MNKNQLNSTALPIPDLVKIMRNAGSRYVSEDAIRKDINSGAPVNPDGTMNLVHYAAWLVKENGSNGL